MSKFVNSTLAVTGAGGHLGRRVVELLLDAGASHVVAMSRDPSKLADLARRGAEIRRASFDEPDSLAFAFAGVDRALIISTDSLQTRTAQQMAAVNAAAGAGVKHIVYTSVTSPYPDPASLVPDSHYWTEVRIAASGLDFSLLRNNQYTDYLIPGAQHAIAGGMLIHAAGTGRRAYVTREDCAAAATGALLRAEGRRVYDVSGPEALSMDDIATLFAEMSGKPVRAQDIPDSDLIAGYVKGGVPENMAAVLSRFDTDTAKGYLGIVGDAVAELVGRPPQSVASFLAANRLALAA